jgi:hypothetical protein
VVLCRQFNLFTRAVAALDGSRTEMSLQVLAYSMRRIFGVKRLTQSIAA